VRVRDYGRGVSGTRSAVINTARGPVTARFSRRFVTSAQLRSALGAVRTDMSKLSSRVKSVEGRMGKLVDQTRKATATAIAGESAKRAREMRRLRKRLEKKIDDGQMMSLMFSFIKEDDTSGTSGTSSTQDLLPLLLLSGGGGGGDDNNMLMMMIAMNVL
jgi:hypothetical protein